MGAGERKGKRAHVYYSFTLDPAEDAGIIKWIGKSENASRMIREIVRRAYRLSAMRRG